MIDLSVIDLSEVTILITSFLRIPYLYDCMEGIRSRLPECKVVVVDDGDHNPMGLPDPCGCDWTMFRMKFDSGLSAKRNAGVKACDTKYLLLGSDDFDFSTPDVQRGIQRLVAALDDIEEIDLVGGRVDGRPYEGNLEYIKGKYIKETRLKDDGKYHGDILRCDLTVNYFLARTKVLREFPWPEEMKIGGEHVCLFLDLKLAGKKVAWVKGVNINTQPYDLVKQDPRYAEFRSRARTLGHPLMMKRYNIQQYIGF